MTDLAFFLLLIVLALAAGLWVNQRQADRRTDDPAPAAWTCPVCGHPVTSEPPYWTVDSERVCSLSCARDKWRTR